MGDYEFSEDGYQADQITRGKINANNPIWNPREYFLVTLLERFTQVAGEWARVVQVIESAFNDFACTRPFFASIGRGPFYCGNIASASSWTRTMLQILRQLLRTTRETIKAWDTFISNNGDIGYFSDLISTPSASAKRIQRALHLVHAAVDDLKSFNGNLLDIQEECEKLERALEVRLMVEANKNTGLTILLICPITVVSTFFAIPASSLTFPRNVWSFTGGVIIITVVLYVLRLPAGGWFGHGQQLSVWRGRVGALATAARRGDRGNTIQPGSVPRLIRRRATHPVVRERE